MKWVCTQYMYLQQTILYRIYRNTCNKYEKIMKKYSRRKNQTISIFLLLSLKFFKSPLLKGSRRVSGTRVRKV